MAGIDKNYEKEKILTYLAYYKDTLVPKLLSAREYEAVEKKLAGEDLTPTERVYLSRSVKKKLEAARVATALGLLELVARPEKYLTHKFLKYLNSLELPEVQKGWDKKFGKGALQNKVYKARNLLIITNRDYGAKSKRALRKMGACFSKYTIVSLDRREYADFSLLKNGLLDRKAYEKAEALAREADMTLLLGDVGDKDYIRDLVEKSGTPVAEISERPTLTSPKARGGIRRKPGDLLIPLYKYVLGARIGEIVQKHNPPRGIVAVYTFGSIEKGTNHLPNDADMLIVTKSEKTQNKLHPWLANYTQEIRDKLWINPDVSVRTEKEFMTKMDNVIKGVMDNPGIAYGKNIVAYLYKKEKEKKARALQKGRAPK